MRLKVASASQKPILVGVATPNAISRYLAGTGCMFAMNTDATRPLRLRVESPRSNARPNAMVDTHRPLAVGFIVLPTGLLSFRRTIQARRTLA